MLVASKAPQSFQESNKNVAIVQTVYNIVYKHVLVQELLLNPTGEDLTLQLGGSLTDLSSHSAREKEGRNVSSQIC